jgi:hypothetical protein
MTAEKWWMAAALASTLLGSAGCDKERKAECDQFLTAMKPLDQGTPTSELVDSVAKQVDAIKLEDQPLVIYAQNYQAKLKVLSSTLKLKAGGSAPDGTDAVIQGKLKEARTDAADVQRYCEQ